MPRTLMLLFLCAVFLCTAQVAFADTPPAPRPTRLPTPLPGGGMMPTWMTPPAPGPAQADAGALLYYNRCMACHGDRGQGLTTEWRAQWDVEHQDCSRSTCHGPRHPPEGFTFPKNFAPAIIGANTLLKYENAQALFNFISMRMPYQSPGALSRDEYWQLVAYLLRQRGVHTRHVDETNASRVSLTASAPQFPVDLLFVVVGGMVAVALAGAVMVWRWRRRDTTSPSRLSP